MKHALKRLAAYCAVQSVIISAARDGFTIRPRGMPETNAHTIGADELADRVETHAGVAANDPGEAAAAVRTLQRKGYAWRGGEEWAPPIGSTPAFIARELDGAAVLHAEGYEQLADVLLAAFHQAASGKGKERHAQKGEPFHQQVMQQGAQRFGTGALLFQAFKKSEESQRLPHERAEAELLGAIVYLAGAVIAERNKHANRSQAANDPRAQVAANA